MPAKSITNSAKVFAVGFDHALIPIITVFQAALACAVKLVIVIDIDEAVSLFNFRRRATDYVDWTPRIISPEINTVFYGFDTLLDVCTQIVNAVRVVDRTVCFHLVIGTEPVFRNVERLLVAVPILIERNAESERVNAPSPVGKRKNEKTERILVQVKNNLEQVGPSLVYELTDHIEWKEQSEISADDLFMEFITPAERATKKAKAKEELIELLMEKDQPQAYIKDYFEKMDISFRTVQEAQKELGIKPYRLHNQSYWPYPATTQQ